MKPNSKKTAAGYLQVGVETYGGGLWHTWFDRDLSVAGRVFVKEGDNSVPKLVKIDKPILRIPTLAIHLDSGGAATKFEFNAETNARPILGLVEKELNKREDEENDKTEDKQFEAFANVTERHGSSFVDLIASNLGVQSSDIEDFELLLYDTQPSTLGGIHDEFVFSPRLDNLGSTFPAIKALIESVNDPSSLENSDSIRLISLFDHEEIGSTSAQGANSNFLQAVITRLASLPGTSSTEFASGDVVFQTASNSFLISADMAHAVHPNYQSKHDDEHKPELNKGTVIKINANQRYTTNSTGLVYVKKIAEEAGSPLQLFVVRNDSRCGSTIGPMLSAKLGITTLDLGNPQLSMHSIRETGGSLDVENEVKLFKRFLESYTTFKASVLVDHVETETGYIHM